MVFGGILVALWWHFTKDELPVGKPGFNDAGEY